MELIKKLSRSNGNGKGRKSCNAELRRKKPAIPPNNQEISRTIDVIMAYVSCKY